MRRRCAACGGSGVVAPGAPGFGSLAVARPAGRPAREPGPDGFTYVPVDSTDPSDCAGGSADGCDPGGGDGGE
jgi:hypothetical protein